MSNVVYMCGAIHHTSLDLNGDNKLFTRVAIVERGYDQALFRALVDFAIKRIKIRITNDTACQFGASYLQIPEMDIVNIFSTFFCF